MKIKKNDVFTLMDTNGRRDDVINAFQGYLEILEEVTNRKRRCWGRIPNSLSQFEFYQKAIELSPDVLKKHSPYDKLIKEIEKHPTLKKAIELDELDEIDFDSKEYFRIKKMFDKGIEERARHYTSDLVKMGFVDTKRNISPVGRLILSEKALSRDEIEKLLPIDDINIVYLRQLLKLRIFDVDGRENYYSPFLLALYILLKNNRVTESRFLDIIQGINSYTKIKDLDYYIENYKIGEFTVDIPEELRTDVLVDKNIFLKFFSNRKSGATAEIYWNYYNLLFAFKRKRNAKALKELLDYYESEKEVIKKAFCRGKSLHTDRRDRKCEPLEFIKKHKEIFEGRINENIYSEFIKSKYIDKVHEYKDTTKRIFRATGVVSFENGFVELAYKELFGILFNYEEIKGKIFGNLKEELHDQYRTYDDYEDGISSYFCRVYSVCEIAELSKKDVDVILSKIRKVYKGRSIKDIPALIAEKRRKEFEEFIYRKYPKEKVKELLKMFKDRVNDSLIKKYVCKEAPITTIYEYVVGIAWYYFSDKKIDLLKSFNLTLSADFDPLSHAPGGQGDIVISDKKQVIMLEVTLMNENSQKRGEWEPVLRHSANLKIEEEIKRKHRTVTTFFIADKFDNNTINIWKAIASVPLQSTIHKDRYTDNVIIMPINNDELIKLIDKSKKYDSIITAVRSMFEKEKSSFDIKWRDKFVKKIL